MRDDLEDSRGLEFIFC